MANFFGGVIPTVNVSSNTVTNLVVNGLIQNAGGAAINVALGSVLPEEIGSFLGVSSVESFDNILEQVITPGLVTTGQTLINNLITENIVNSEALGPLGPLVADLATSAVQGLSNELLGGLFGGSGTSEQGNKWFPGAGDEPAAYYNGSPFAGGPTGADVVFSIKSVETLAFTDAVNTFYDTKIPFEMTTTESLFPGVDPESLYTTDLSTISGGLDSGEWGTSSWMSEAADTFTEDSGLPSPFENPGAIPNIWKPPSKNSWNFICAPDEISWSSEAQVERVPVFGTNQPPVTVGSKSMRELTLSNALTEGFTRVKTVEAKVAKLESLMNFTLDTNSGYVKVPVYYVMANDKKYGFGEEGKDGGYFVIKSINVKEEMRDLNGDSTRSIVDVSFAQVPPYQIDSGRDIASKAVRGQDSLLGEAARKSADVISQAAKNGQITAGDSKTAAGRQAKATSGSGVPSATSPNSNKSQPESSTPPKPALPSAGVLTPNPP